jgi:hypothetical protein
MGGFVSYEKRATAADLECLNQAKKILSGQAFSANWPRPQPDVNCNNQLVFTSHEELRGGLTATLQSKEWDYKEKVVNDHSVYYYSRPRNLDYTIPLTIIVTMLELVAICILVTTFISYSVMFKMYDKTWFNEQSLENWYLVRFFL